MPVEKDSKTFQFGNHTDVGKVREANEDYLGYFETKNGHLFIVCDGMGGHAGGATASQMAVESIRRFFEHGYYERVQEALRQSILYANQQILAYAGQHTNLQGMGTTCVVVLVREDELFYAHVGDSRIYLLKNNHIQRLTKDHSVVQNMVDQGMISEEEAEHHPRKNQLTRALGTQPDIQVDVCERPFHPEENDTFLLCTDGLNGMVNDRVIEHVLAGNVSVQHKALKLVQLANDAGGQDNITVQLIQFTPTNIPVYAEDMAVANVKKKNTKVIHPPVNQKVDPALIVLGVLFSIVIVLFIVGFDQMSDEVTVSELSQGQPDYVSDEETVSPYVKPTTNSNTSEKEKPKKEKAVAAKEKEPVAKKVKEDKPALASETSASSKETTISHTVRAGETFSSIARRYNVTNKSLQAWNPAIKDQGKDLKSDVTQLKVKVRAVHKVGAGDVLNVVGKKYGVNKDLIMAANGKTADRAARGEMLVIPFAEKK